MEAIGLESVYIVYCEPLLLVTGAQLTSAAAPAHVYRTRGCLLINGAGVRCARVMM